MNDDRDERARRFREFSADLVKLVLAAVAVGVVMTGVAAVIGRLLGCG